MTLSLQIGEAQIEALYSYAKFQFECGNYSGAADFLYQYRLLATSADRVFSATWGKLAAEILTQNWDAAIEELSRLREMIDQKVRRHPRIRRAVRGRQGKLETGHGSDPPSCVCHMRAQF